MLAIISRLDIAAEDRRWIDSLRRKWDPQHVLVEAHFTLVFPFDGLDLAEIAIHADGVAGAASPVDFRLTDGRAVRDVLAPRSHVFLAPNHGSDEIRALHDRLYAGPLAEKLRDDIPYEPHVTVGAFGLHEDAERAAAGIGPVDIPGRLSTLDLVELDGDTLVFRHRLPLNDTGRRRRAGRRRRS